MDPEHAMITFAKALLSPPDLYYQMMDAVLGNQEVITGLRMFAYDLASEHANQLLVRLAGLAIETPDLPRRAALSLNQAVDDTVTHFLVFVNILHRCSADADRTAEAIREYMTNNLHAVSLTNFAAILDWSRTDPDFLFTVCDELRRLGPLQRFLHVASTR